MKIDSVELVDFRNYKNERVKFFDGLNIIEGKNAQGKTNLLEAIYMCAIGKSPRVSKEKEVILWGKDYSRIKVICNKKFTNESVEMFFSKKQKKTVKINSGAINRMGELMGRINVVYFSPDELKLIKESPEDRRKFMDISLSQMSKQYFYLISRYEKALANRNKLLKMFNKIETIKETVGVWNIQLAELGAKIIEQRIEFLNKISEFAQKAHFYLTNNEEKLELSYAGVFSKSVESTKEELLNKLEKNLEKDFELGYTTLGPHRDDIKVNINGVDTRTFGSQGQQRTASLSLKLAEVEILNQTTGEMPVLLLDDVLSELDEFRRSRLLKFTQKTQTILTCNEFNHKEIKANFFVVSGGEVSRIDK